MIKDGNRVHFVPKGQENIFIILMKHSALRSRGLHVIIRMEYKAIVHHVVHKELVVDHMQVTKNVQNYIDFN